MRKLIVSALVSLLVAAFTPLGRTDASVLSIVRVHVESPEQAAYLMGNFDETHNHGPNEIELLLWPGDLAELDSLGLDYEVVVEDLVAHDRSIAAASDAKPSIQPGPDRTDYRRLADYNAEMHELADKNKGLVELFEMKRPSLEGRTVYGIEIAADVKDKTDGRPIFYLDAVHHAREWPAAEFTMIFAHHLVEGYGKNPQVTSLLKRARVIVVPVVNVDGFDYSRESVTSAHPTVASNTELVFSGSNGFEGYWRKNRRSLTGVTVPVAQKNPDAYGVDPNRNYSYLWGDQHGGSSGTQVDQTYRGEAPFSEPEVANVRDIVLNRNVTGVITNHTYQSSVLRAGGGESPEDEILKSLGQKMADVLGYQNNGTVGYPTTGTTDDWAYAVMGAVGYTIEHGTEGFHPPYASFVAEHNDEVSKAFTVMLEAVADPKYHSVLTGRVHGGPAKLTLTKTFRVPLSEGNPLGEEFVVEKIKYTMTTDKNGRFEWHVGPSTSPWNTTKKESYTLTVSSGGAETKMPVTVDRGKKLDLGTIHMAMAAKKGKTHNHGDPAEHDH